MKLELSYIQTTQQWKAWPQRERESTLTLLHTFHRTRIPFGHVLIERICAKKHCKRGCNEAKKEQPTTQRPKRFRFKNRKAKNNNTCENCDPMKLELPYIQKHNNGRRGHREGEREYTYCYAYLSPHPYSIWTRPD